MVSKSVQQKAALLLIFVLALPSFFPLGAGVAHASSTNSNGGGNFLDVIKDILIGVVLFIGVKELWTGLSDTVGGWFKKDKAGSIDEFYKTEQERQDAALKIIAKAGMNDTNIDISEPDVFYLARTKDGSEVAMTKEQYEAIFSGTPLRNEEKVDDTDKDPLGSGVYVVEVVHTNVQNALVEHTKDITYYYVIKDMMTGEQIGSQKSGYMPFPWEEVEKQEAYGNNVLLDMTFDVVLPTGEQRVHTQKIPFGYIGSVNSAIASPRSFEQGNNIVATAPGGINLEASSWYENPYFALSEIGQRDLIERERERFALSADMTENMRYIMTMENMLYEGSFNFSILPANEVHWCLNRFQTQTAGNNISSLLRSLFNDAKQLLEFQPRNQEVIDLIIKHNAHNSCSIEYLRDRVIMEDPNLRSLQKSINDAKVKLQLLNIERTGL